MQQQKFMLIVKITQKYKNCNTMSGNLNMSGNKVTGLPTSILDAAGDSDAVSKQIMVDVAAGVRSNCLQRLGDTMSEQIDMNSNTIINVSHSSNGQDAASKNYIDTALSGCLSKFGRAAEIND